MSIAPSTRTQIGLGLLCAAVLLGQVALWAFFVDDAYISFRYARNLVDGHGLVFNPGGERVEGYTNPLWVLILAAGMVLGIAPEVTAMTIGTASGLAILTVLAHLSAQTRGWTSPGIWAAPALLVISRSFPAWCTGGLETQLFAALALAGVVAGIHEAETPERTPWLSALLLALATLTRPEGLLPTAVVGIALLARARQGRLRWAHLAGWLAVWSAPVGAHLAFRRAYYGTWLPNPFHAKVNGVWWDQGLDYVYWFHHDYNALWFAWLALVAVIAIRGTAHRMLGAWLALHLVYVAIVGGDRFEFRFLVHVAPAFAWLVVEGAYAVGERMRSASDPDLGGHVRSGILAVVALFVALSNAESPAQSRDGITTLANMARITEKRTAQGRELRALIDAGTLPEFTACFQAVGAISYFADVDVLDYHGLTDRQTAMQPTVRRGVVAHEKSASPERMRERGVDVYDPVGDAIVEGRQLEDARRKAAEKIPKLGDGSLRLHCRVVGPDRYFLYASPQTPEHDSEHFGHLPDCPQTRVSAPVAASTARRPNAPLDLLFVSIDTVRADHLGPWGDRAHTPNIDALAANSAVFDHFVAAAPTTLSSHTTLMTGTYAQRHGIPRNGHRLHGDNRMLAEVLAEAGYHTAAFVGGRPLDSETAFDQGFGVFDDRFGGHERPGSEVTEAALRWFSRPLRGPRFAFVHYFDAHYPYTEGAPPPDPLPADPPPQGGAGSMAHIAQVRRMLREGDPRAAVHVALLDRQYAAGVELVDRHVGELIEGLRQRGRLEHTLVVLTSDHGEGLGEHAEHWDHGWEVHGNTLHVPLLIRRPGHSAVRIEGAMPAVDLFPTLLELLNLPDAPSQGTSRAAEIDGSVPVRGLAFSEATRQRDQTAPGPWGNANQPRSVRDAAHTLIYSPLQDRWEAYAHPSDPDERTDIWTPGQPALADLTRALEHWESAPTPLPAPPIDDPDTKAQLEALGYAQ